MTGAARLREALDVLLEALERVDISGQVGDVEDLDAAIHDGCEALAAVPEAPEPVEVVSLPLPQALSILEKLRMASLWCGPKPDDWQSHKWPEDLCEEFGVECAGEFRALLAELGGPTDERRTAPGPWERVEEGTER